MSILAASQLPLVQKSGIKIDVLSRLIQTGKIRSVDLTSPGAKYRMLRTTEKWIKEGFAALGYVEK